MVQSHSRSLELAFIVNLAFQFVFFFFCFSQERAELISKQYDADKAKLEKIRLLLVMFENLVLPFTAAFNESTVKGILSIQPCWCPIEIWFKSLGGEQAFFAGQAKQKEDFKRNPFSPVCYESGHLRMALAQFEDSSLPHALQPRVQPGLLKG